MSTNRLPTLATLAALAASGGAAAQEFDASVAALNSPQSEIAPWVSDNGLEMILASNRLGLGNFDLWTSRRASTATPWPAPTLVSALSSPFFDGGASVTGNGQTIYFCSERTGVHEIYTATRQGSSWTPPQLVPLGPGEKSCPAVSRDGNTLYFAMGTVGTTTDLFFSMKILGVFGPPQPVQGPINSIESENSPFLSADGRLLFYSSDAPPASSLDVWVSESIGPNVWGPPRMIASHLFNTPTEHEHGFAITLQNQAYMSTTRGVADYDINTWPYMHTMEVFGASCPAATGENPWNFGLGRPALNSTLRFGATNLPPGVLIAFMELGFSNTISPSGPLPINLAFVGIPQCWINVSLDSSNLMLPAGGTARYGLFIPNASYLIGMMLYWQVAALEASTFYTSRGSSFQVLP